MPSIDVVQAIFEMTKGTTMLKAGRMGRPHFRHFRLLEDLSGLQWESPKKDKGESSVAIQKIQGLVRGQTTKVFQVNPIPEYESLSFSLIYKQGPITRTLDIVCKDRAEFDIWTVGLDALLDGFSDISAVTDFAEKVSCDEVDGNQKKMSLAFGFVGETVSVKEDACDIYTWGSSFKGMLGHGEETEETIPRVVEALLGRDVRKIACGTEHMLAVSSSGELFSWGSGRGGKLGFGNIQDRFTPLKVATLADKKITCIACNELHSAAINADGELYTWGRAGPRLGYEVVDGKQMTPRLVDSLSARKVTDVDCGLDYTAVVTADGQVFTFGENEKGQLGLGDTENHPVPTLVESLSQERVIMVRCGTSHTGLVTEGGEVWMWGSNDFGQLGLGDQKQRNVPCKIPSTFWNELIVNISCGGRHTAVLSASGTVYSFGDGRNGQLGVRVKPDTPFLTTPSAVRIGAQMKTTQVDCGVLHTAAVSEDGDLYIWGKGSSARLGHGDHKDRHMPLEIEAMIYKKVKLVSCGGRTTAACVIRSWVQDQETKSCMACKLKFTTVRRRHHCRKCGGIFCANCSSKRIPILEVGYIEPVRVCDRCFHILSENTS
eukprot:gene3523-4025_t